MSALGRRELSRLARLPGSLSRYGSALHVVGLSTRGRNTRAAELAGVTDRTIRRAAQALRSAEIRIPPALPGRPPRTNYRGSRRGFRRRRGRRGLDPVELAARSLGRPKDVRQLVELVRQVLHLWPVEQYPHASPVEAAQAIGMYLAAGGRLGPEADRWWRYEAQRLPLERAHTPWRAAAAGLHLGPWLAHRRAKELRDREERIRAARSDADTYKPSDAEIAAMRARLRGRGG